MIHNVYFWLKSDLSAEQIALFNTRIKSLLQVESVKYGKVGTPSSTRRPAIDHTYAFHLLTVFDSMEGHDLYQVHPLHKKFLEDCSTFWEKVIVYDSDEI